VRSALEIALFVSWVNRSSGTSRPAIDEMRNSRTNNNKYRDRSNHANCSALVRTIDRRIQFAVIAMASANKSRCIVRARTLSFTAASFSTRVHTRNESQHGRGERRRNEISWHTCPQGWHEPRVSHLGQSRTFPSSTRTRACARARENV